VSAWREFKADMMDAYGKGVVDHIEKLGVELTRREKELVVFASWDGVWFGMKVGATWTTIALGILALVLR